MNSVSAFVYRENIGKLNAHDFTDFNSVTFWQFHSCYLDVTSSATRWCNLWTCIDPSSTRMKVDNVIILFMHFTNNNFAIYNHSLKILLDPWSNFVSSSKYTSWPKILWSLNPFFDLWDSHFQLVLAWMVKFDPLSKRNCECLIIMEILGLVWSLWSKWFIQFCGAFWK